MIDTDDMNILIVNVHDLIMKEIQIEYGTMPCPLGEVSFEQIQKHKKYIICILDTLFYMGYKVEK